VLRPRNFIAVSVVANDHSFEPAVEAIRQRPWLRVGIHLRGRDWAGQVVRVRDAGLTPLFLI